MTFGPRWLAQRLGGLLPEFPDTALCVALSGGVDSVTLLAGLAARRKGTRSKGSRLRAVHVHHGLHPNADRWSKHCEKVAARLNVPLTVLRVKVARPRGASLEAAAREARYSAIAEVLEPGEVLVTAHHEDDQLETVLLQLMRGAGVAGLAAMPEVAPFERGRLVRPLLTCSRAELEEWARAQGLSWVDDDTNADERLDRNYLRRRVLPAIRERWPSAASAASRSARHAAEARRLLDALALADVELAANGRELSVPRLRALNADRRRNAVRFWITRAGFVVPDTRRLDEIVGPLLNARVDANPQVSWKGVRLQRHMDRLALFPANENAATSSASKDGRRARGDTRVTPRSSPESNRRVSAALAASEPEARAGATRSQAATSSTQRWHWRTSAAVAVNGGGTLAIESDGHGPLDLDSLPETLTLRVRRGGERLRPSRGRPTKTLKALLQEARIPLAERERLPLVFAGEQLVAAGDRWIDASAQAQAHTRRRGRLLWSRETGSTPRRRPPPSRR
jgi:tRNA(Ile)-lysidine synthase